MESDVRSFTDASALAGEELRRAREARNLSIVDVARQIHLSTSQVRDLEQGRAESFHNAQVRRRLGGRYCDFLELPRSLVADSPRPDSPLLLPGTPVRARPAGSRPGYGPWWMVGLLALLGVVAVQAGWQWWGSHRWDLPFGPFAGDSVSTPAPAPAAISAPTSAPIPAPVPTPSPALAGVPPQVFVSPAPANPPGTAPVVNKPAPSAPVSAGRLQIRANGERCWIEILHDQGRTARVLQPGQVIDLPAVGLHKVFVGNVRAITATLNGQPLDLRPTGGVTARYDAP